MITAFQRSAFQNNAFQIGVTVEGGGDRWSGLPALWQRAQEEAERRRKAREKLEREEAESAAVVVEIVTAQAAPVVTDLSALALAAPAAVVKIDDGLDRFMAAMLKLAREEVEC